MPFDNDGPLGALLAIAATIAPGAQLGIPEALDTRLSCYIVVGDETIRAHTVSGPESGTIRRDQVYVVTFGYRVQGHEADAELAVARAQVAFTIAVYADRTLGGTVKSVRVDSSLVSAPLYADFAVQENRLYAIGVEVQQEHTI